MNTTQKSIVSIVAIIIALLLFFTAGLKISFIDDKTDTYFKNGITKAGLAYATCRVINASVSIVKDSSLHLEPAGVGVSLAIGQALDPIDDMAERLSDVLVTAITSLGVLKLGHEISIFITPKLFSIVLVVFSILIWFDHKRLIPLKKIMLSAVILIFVSRFFLPISSAINNYLNTAYFDHQISDVRGKLSTSISKLDTLKEYTLPEIKGFFGTIENSAAFIKKKSIELQNALSLMASNMGDIIQNLLTLTFLYVGLFLIQVIILPLLTFWLLTKLINSIAQVDLPFLIHKH